MQAKKRYKAADRYYWSDGKWQYPPPPKKNPPKKKASFGGPGNEKKF